jgi:GNAT superfamily N-acetyltransferase
VPTPVQRIAPNHAADALALLEQLHVSAFGISSPRLHAALVDDAFAGRIDCRVAIESGRVVGLVLAAPASYWQSAFWTHWRLAAECVLARLRGRLSSVASHSHPPVERGIRAGMEEGPPPRTWTTPGDAWRIIFIGTAPAVRRRGIAAQLYRTLMIDRSLVARIAADNAHSLELHRTLGWRLYPDGDVVLAVYLRKPPAIRSSRQQIAV